MLYKRQDVMQDRYRMDLSIIVPVYNDPETLGTCLNHIVPHLDERVECIVVDDGSTDRTPDVARSFPVRFEPLSVNQGPSIARNAGAAVAKGAVYFFIDTDVLLQPDSVSVLKSVFDQHPDVDAVIGSYDTTPGDRSFLSQYKNLSHHYVHQHANSNAQTFWGACGGIRAAAFHSVGGFSERFSRPSVEDIELGYRLRQNGYHICLEKRLQVTHLKRWSFRNLICTDLFDRAIPWTVLMLERNQLQDDLNTAPEQRMALVLAWLGLIAALSLLVVPGGVTGVIVFGLVLGMVAINADYYRFFRNRRGLWFAIRVFPLHWLYYLYSGIGFGWGWVVYMKNNTRE